MTIGVVTVVRRSSDVNRVNTTIPINTTLASAVFAALPSYTTATSRKSAILALKKVWKLVHAWPEGCGNRTAEVYPQNMDKETVGLCMLYAWAHRWASTFGVCGNTAGLCTRTIGNQWAFGNNA